MPEPRKTDDTTRCGCANPRCPGAGAGGAISDLDRLLAAPDFTSTFVTRPVDAVLGDLPTLDQVVGVTAAGPVIANDLGVHHPPSRAGDPLRIPSAGISLRVNPELLGTVLVTDPTPQVPPTLRFFDRAGNAAHVTYLVDGSDRLAFESIGLTLSGDVELHEDAADDRPAAAPPESAEDPLEVDQLGLLDAVLADSGRGRLAALVGQAAHVGERRAGFHRVPPRSVIDALTHAASLTMPLTTCISSSGILQLRHDRLHAVKEHHGSMVLASQAARTMINFTAVAQCWVTRAEGAWGPTGAIELYDRRGRCCFVATQTGPVDESTRDGWAALISDLVDSRR
ncbi:MAG: heme transporter [Gordonia sp. (in: high G+C Gram-positive bacteria)]|uniref:heme transporter n=1 Tax=Gordonia sp. (in: high G+C Gram-positive bacteria) TaxID=84139 RepID=UPI0039E6F005